ncbi:hypothetical protein ES705_43720 [subsurface metagenome]
MAISSSNWVTISSISLLPVTSWVTINSAWTAPPGLVMVIKKLCPAVNLALLPFFKSQAIFSPEVSTCSVKLTVFSLTSNSLPVPVISIPAPVFNLPVPFGVITIWISSSVPTASIVKGFPVTEAIVFRKLTASAIV